MTTDHLAARQSEPHRSVGWIELFYDLVFVATLIQIGNFLGGKLELSGIAQYVLLITMVWWSWTGMAFFNARFEVDSLLQRSLVFVQMAAIAIMGLSIGEAFTGLSTQFTIAYVVSRLLLVALYAVSFASYPGRRALTGRHMVGLSLGAIIWLGSLLFPAELRWTVWLIGLLVELAFPLTAGMARHRKRWPVDAHYLTERFGIFVIIVLGESFIKFLDATQGYEIGMTQLAYGGLGLLVVFSLWWLYFGHARGIELSAGEDSRSLAWVYGHLPLTIGLVAAGVAAKKLYTVGNELAAHQPLPDEYRLLYGGALAICLCSLPLVTLGVNGWYSRKLRGLLSITYLAVATAILGVAVLFPEISRIMLVGSISFLLLSLVWFVFVNTKKVTGAPTP